MNELIRQIQNAQSDQEFRHIMVDAVAYNGSTRDPAANNISCSGSTIQPLLDAISAAVERFSAQETTARREFTLGQVGVFLSSLPQKITDGHYDIKNHISTHLNRTGLGEQLSELAGRNVYGLRRGTDPRENIESAKNACQNLRIPVYRPRSHSFFSSRPAVSSALSGALNQRETQNERQLKEWGFKESQLDTALKNIYRTILCPIAYQVMDDPVKLSTQRVYDRASLRTYLETASLDTEGKASCPLTRRPFKPEEVESRSTDQEILNLVQSFMKEIQEMKRDSSIQMTR